jgi:hypothetical protein
MPNSKFPISIKIPVPPTPQGSYYVADCAKINPDLSGPVVFVCGVNSNVWDGMAAQGGCSEKSCPFFEFWSNGAEIDFEETRSGDPAIVTNCPRTFATKFYTGVITMTCPKGSNEWSASGQCISCDLECVGGVLDTMACACQCKKNWFGTRCETCNLECVAGQGVKNAAACTCSCNSGFDGETCDKNLTPLTPAEMGFPMLYLLLFLWRNLGELLNPTLFMIIALFLDLPGRLGLTKR